MSGFLLLHSAAARDNPAALRQAAKQASAHLLRSHAPCAPPRFTQIEENSFWCAKVDNTEAPSSPLIRHAHDGSWVFTLGPIAYRKKRVTEDGLPELLSAVRHDASGTAKQLDGSFVVVLFDNERQRMLVIPSALGQYAVFVRRTDQGVVGVSSSVLALAALGRVTLDEFGCRTIYRVGHRLPPHTLFQEIRSVPEGSLLELGSGRYEVQRYWTPSFQSASTRTFSAAAAEVAHELSDYCVSLIEPGKPVASDFTGGFDSRVSTACLLHAGIPFVPTVAGPPGHPDVELAAQICRAENLPLRVTDTAEHPDKLAAEMQAALLLCEGSINAFEFATTWRVKQALFAGLGGRPVTTISGGLGESFRDFFWAQEFFDKGKRQPASIDKLIRYRIDARQFRMDFFAEDWHHAWRVQLHDYLAQIIAPFADERNTAQLDAVYLRKMSGMICSFSTAAARFSAPLVPFSAIAALDAALPVPPQWRFDSRLLRAVAWALHPRFASYKTLKGCPCAPMTFANWPQFLPKYVNEAKRLARKISMVWFRKAIFPDYVDPEPAANPYAGFIADELRGGGHFDWESMRTARWYAPEALKGLLAEARTPAGYRLRHTISWIYTCEALARLADAREVQANAREVAAHA